MNYTKKKICKRATFLTSLIFFTAQQHANAQPMLGQPCDSRKLLRSPRAEYFNKDCSVAYIIPPKHGKVITKSVTSLDNLEFCDAVLENEETTNELVQTLQTIKHRIRTLDADLEANAEQLRVLGALYLEHDLEIQRVTRKLKNLNSDYARVQLDIDDLSEELELCLSDECELIENELANANEDLQEIAQEIEQLTIWLEGARPQLTEINAQIRELEKEHQELTDLTPLIAKLGTIQAQIREYRELSSLDGAIVHLSFDPLWEQAYKKARRPPGRRTVRRVYRYLPIKNYRIDATRPELLNQGNSVLKSFSFTSNYLPNQISYEMDSSPIELPLDPPILPELDPFIPPPDFEFEEFDDVRPNRRPSPYPRRRSDDSFPQHPRLKREAPAKFALSRDRFREPGDEEFDDRRERRRDEPPRQDDSNRRRNRDRTRRFTNSYEKNPLQIEGQATLSLAAACKRLEHSKFDHSGLESLINLTVGYKYEVETFSSSNTTRFLEQFDKERRSRFRQKSSGSEPSQTSTDFFMDRLTLPVARDTRAKSRTKIQSTPLEQEILVDSALVTEHPAWSRSKTRGSLSVLRDQEQGSLLLFDAIDQYKSRAQALPRQFETRIRELMQDNSDFGIHLSNKRAVLEKRAYTFFNKNMK